MTAIITSVITSVITSAITGLFTLWVCHLTSKRTAQREVETWKREDSKQRTAAIASAKAAVSQWLNQPYNLHKKDVATRAVSEAATLSEGDTADVLNTICAELSKEFSNEKLIRNLILRAR